MLRPAALAVLLLASMAFAELPVGEQLLHTKDGRELRGTIVSETQQGYVLRAPDGAETMVPFSDIQDLVPAGDAPPPVAPPPPPPPLPPPEPGADGQPPPPAEGDAAPAEPDQPAPNDWRSLRKGFHWSIGAGGMIDPGFTTGGTATSPVVAFYVGAVPAVRWGFGWLDLQAELMPLGYFKGAVKAFFLGLNPQLRINFARFFSLGVGLWGAVVLSPGVDFCLGPSFSPAIFRIGDLGQHEIRFWTGSAVFATSVQLTSNVVLMMLSYSYVF